MKKDVSKPRFSYRPDWILDLGKERDKTLDVILSSKRNEERRAQQERNVIYGVKVEDITRALSKFVGNKLIYMTHGLHIYPAKFIPQIPQLCIRKYSQPADYIIDPMCGSGTTLVEAMLLGRHAYGIDINPLAQLIARVKTTPLEVEELDQYYHQFLEFLELGLQNRLPPIKSIPTNSDFPNLEYWFSEKVRMELKQIQNQINHIEKKQIREFFLVVLSTIIRKVSLADDDQLHPAKTKYAKTRKQSDISVFKVFKAALLKKYKIMRHFSSYDFSEINCEIIGSDATEIALSDGIQLAVTSPPYVNALDYIRIHKLEAFWVGAIKTLDLRPLHLQFIGTEKIYVEEYQELSPTPNARLNALLKRIHKIDKKRAGIILKYFTNMTKNLGEIHRILPPHGKYCIIIGSNYIHNILVPTPKILIELAEAEFGFKNIKNYSYTIINRRLKIPRADHGGTIRKEWIIVLEK
ncbi:MAG: DNA methyltransferase [Candidatus Helarchaeota archaeon]